VSSAAAAAPFFAILLDVLKAFKILFHPAAVGYRLADNP
jgi:hypothetical protein